MKPSVYYSYLELNHYLETLKDQYPERFKLESIGLTLNQRSIPMLIFGQGKHKILATGGVHGRESINPPVLISMAEQYLHNPDKLEKLDGQVYLIPLLNPDGYEIARQDYILWKNNGKGVDINRNFPSKTYRAKWEGDRPGSEEETQALMEVMNRVLPDGYIDYHSRGKSIFCYRSQMDEVYNERQYKIAQKLKKVTGYKLEEPIDEIEEGDSGGNTVHYFSEKFERPAITIETVADPERFPLNPLLQIETLYEIKDTFQVFLQAL